MTTIRMQNIPLGTHKRQLLRKCLNMNFPDWMNQDELVKDFLGFSQEVVLSSTLEVSPDNSNTMTGTITLRSMSEVQKLLKIDKFSLSASSFPVESTLRVAIDTHFHGLTVVAGGDNRKLDIIAIHGLNGHAFDSWTVDNVMWLRDLLPKQVPDARVLLYGYNANVIKDASRARIQEHARLFIRCLQGLEEIQKRRVIFICHSLGGLVLKQALIFISNGIEYSTLRNVALGVIFLGTPHKGSAQAELADILVNIARISFGRNAMHSMRTLEKDSAGLMDLAHNFRELHPELKFASFCEQLPMKLPGRFFTKAIDLGVVVDVSSATLDVEGESIIPVDRDHVTIAKYASAGDGVYRLLVDHVKKMAASSKIQKKSTPKVTTEYRDMSTMSLGISKSSSSRLPSPSDTDVASETFPEVQTSHNPSPSPQPEPVHFVSRIQFKIVDKTGQDFHVIDHAVKGTSDIWEETSLATLKLKMRESGASGSLLLSNSKSSESFSVVAGMHDDNPWCDIVVDVPGNAVSRLMTDSYHGSRSGRLSANSEMTSSRGTIISLTISDLQSDGDRIATILIRNRGQISTPPPEGVELDIPPAPDYAYRILFHVVDKMTDRFYVAAKNLLDPDDDLWETFSPTQLRLCMTDSERSGTLLFEDRSYSERFSIAAGIHNGKPWCDIITDLPAKAKLPVINKTYYQSRGESLLANSTRARKVSLRGTVVLLKISGLEWDGGYTATVTISSTV